MVRALLLCVIVAAASPAGKFAGTFAYDHDVIMMAYVSKEACVADKGRWEDDACVFVGQDRVEISSLPGKKKYRVYVTIVGANAHTCEFDGTGVMKKPGVITATNGDEPSCEVTVSYNADDSVSVTNNRKESCRYYCGARAVLEIEKAWRVK